MRRLRSTRLAGLTLGLACCLSSAQAEQPVAPATFLADAQHSGVFHSPAPKGMKHDISPTPILKLKWSFKTRGKIRSSAAVSGDTVFVGSEDGNLYALDKKDGTLRWKFATDGEISSSPALCDNTLFFVGEDNTLFALDAKSGQKKWVFKTGPNLPYQIHPAFPMTWDYYVSSPTVSAGKVFFGSGDGNLYAVNASNGNLAWKFKTEGRVRTTPALLDNIVYFGSFDCYLYAVRTDNGELKWKQRTEGNQYFKGEIQFSPSVGDGIVCFGARDGFVYALDAKTGERKWRADHKGSWATACVVNNGVVYACSSDGAFVQALDAATGLEKWHFPAGGRVFSSPAITGNLVFFGAQNAFVTGLDLKEGKPQIGSGANGEFNASPVISEGVLYIGCDDSYFYAFE
jgi:outer membrane protein assembly factor BamB